jgi:hypothetical protein
LKGAIKYLTAVIPIVASQCLNQVQINLIDFSIYNRRLLWKLQATDSDW